MSDAGNRTVLCPSRPVRRFTLVFLLAGLVVGGLYAAMALIGHGVHLLLPVVLVMFVMIGRPIVILCGRTGLGADRIVVRRTPIGARVVPISRVGLVEIRRGLLMEWPVLYLRDGRLVQLTAPMRFWLHDDPAFRRGMHELLERVGQRTEPGPCHWSPVRIVAGPVLVTTALVVVLVHPPWASDVWPLRVHAERLPDACRMLDAEARRLVPGARVDPLFSRSDDSDPYVKRHTCRWNATHPAHGDTTRIDIARLGIEVELDHGIGPTSDAEEAHRAFVQAAHIDPGETRTRIPRTGDEADLITKPADAAFDWVIVAVRKANVEEKIDLIYQGAGKQREAAAVATDLARSGLSKIRFH